jgi:hypothetical protein
MAEPECRVLIPGVGEPVGRCLCWRQQPRVVVVRRRLGRRPSAPRSGSSVAVPFALAAEFPGKHEPGLGLSCPHLGSP